MKSKEPSVYNQLRLDALAAYRILHTPEEKEFDLISELATEIFKASNSTISFLDEASIWHKSRTIQSFTGHYLFEIIHQELVVNKRDFFQVDDLTQHELFENGVSENIDFPSLVCSPITDKNKNVLGAICLMDSKPKQLSDNEKMKLKGLCDMVTQQLEFRLLNKHFNQYITTQTEELRNALTSLRKNILETDEEKKQLQADLLEEKQLSKLRAQLVKSISEQFRSPLTTITSSTQLIEMTSNEASSSLEKHLKRILASVKSISGMMDDVLYLHELDFVNLEKDAQPIDAEKLIHSILNKAKLEARAVEDINVRCLEGENLKFKGNRDAIEKLLRVLSSNALKFNSSGSPIHINYSVNTDSFQFNINNKGPLIEKEELGKIYDMFYKGTNSAEKDGLGLGLSIAHKIVKSLGGKIKVESSEKLGTTFYVLIPTME